jgi:hypothetical protein
MAVELVTDTFEPHLGTTFRGTPSDVGEPLELVLSSCVESPHARPDHPAFSLFFDASDPDVRHQQIFALEHAELGQFDLFLVPVGRTESGGVSYEAVIN